MMNHEVRATIGHIGINLSHEASSFPFWHDLLSYLGFTVLPDGNHFDASDGRSYLCVSVTKPAYQQPPFHRRRTGLNHIAFQVASAKAVDRFVEEFLTPRGIAPLYDGAEAYPQYVEGYYAVYFEDPDRIKIEVTYDPTTAGS
jgi:catechol 2,3-dioxygenase-like lactoylglutathione lyase family enzyme